MRRGTAEASSAELYSRDDVWEALEGQDRVLEQIHAGWLPLTPMARGGQSPIQQLPLLQPQACKPFAQPAACFPLLPDFGASASSPPAQQVQPVLPVQATPDLELVPLHTLAPGEPADVASLGDAEEVFFLRAKSGIIHVAAPSELCVGVQHLSLWMKPACGMLSAELAVVASVPPGARLCKHEACQGLLSRCA